MRFCRNKACYYVIFGINLCDNAYRAYEVYASSELAALRKAEKIIQQDTSVKSYGLSSINKVSLEALGS